MSSDGDQDANSPIPPDPTNIADPVSISGEVKSAILSKEEPVPDELIDSDEDIKTKRSKRGGRTNGAADDVEEDGGDLFGDDSDEDQPDPDDAPKQRQLDDEELDSGDDMERNDRAASGTPAAQPEEPKEELVQYSEFGRQPEPEPSDGEMYLLKVPKFLSIEPTMFDIPSFTPPQREHHSRHDPPPTFSAFNTAMSTIRWRHSPSDPAQLQSNARVLRWSDGSLTLQLASDPTQQYEIDGNALAPPQKNPLKPTPTSLKPASNQETYTYLTAPHEAVGLLRTTHKITAGLSIFPSQKTTDDALERLQSSLAAAVRGKNAHHGTGIEVMPVVEDPDLMRRKAELAEKEKERAQKRRMAAENRDRDRTSRTLGRAGLTSSRYGGGLTAGMLEDDELGAGQTRPRAKPKARRQRNDEYSSDEDLGRRRGNFANDDYEVDDFVAGSDEEEDEAEAESEEEDVDDGIDLGRAGKGGGGGRRRSRDDAEEEDAEGEEDEDVRAAPKAKRRRAVVDDEDEE
ncbi:Leo1-like protein [Elsinoe fawcettii]|nr:Leo1-like protein [Elsinoe fawcettii]